MSKNNLSSEKINESLERIQSTILWLSVNIVHHANNLRKSKSGVKVGGHQASSSSVVTIMTALYFDFMNSLDRISVKPHASPVYHAIQYLLDNLDERYMSTLRELHGIQAYPSRTKDPDNVDFSTGSVGIGGIAPNFASLVERYINSQSNAKRWGIGGESTRRYISLLGDAELDEGSVWEAIAEPTMSNLDNVIWVVDLNRQSLDRVIPGIRVGAWGKMFAANGWTVINAKYGSKLQNAFKMPNGELFRETIDQMPNELYQRLLRVSGNELREWLPKSSTDATTLNKFISQWDDNELQELVRNLGGHDFTSLRTSLRKADKAKGPAVIFAYTLKGWMLPSVGDPQNHSVILSQEQMDQLRSELNIGVKEWPKLQDKSEEWHLKETTKQNLFEEKLETEIIKHTFPTTFGRSYKGQMSTQQIFGLILTEISRGIPGLTDKVVTVSPDVASSTNLGGWINKVGVWGESETTQMPEDVQRALNWQQTPDGQHIELGISENNLFMMLGQLGLSHEMFGQTLFPIGTVYDPFVRRGLDALFYGVYSGSRFIFVGTPSGITLGPEGGAHQSVVTASIGIDLPETSYYEPCFGIELEWIVLHALENIRQRTESTYLRLTTKRIDQQLLKLPVDESCIEELRINVIQGAYRIVDRSAEPEYLPGENVVNVFATGAMVPEAINSSNSLLNEGLYLNVINVTGPGKLYSSYQKWSKGFGSLDQDKVFLPELLTTAERKAPIVTVIDGHSHALSWIGSAIGSQCYPIGVNDFGQSGDIKDLYKEYGLDADSISAICYGALGL
ncbi:MAG: pyruvate dehydrogenase [SAR202 cluster bacterium]|nr:pyruvate dehydrogenase [SAR202 cluster bacterium]|tara:strand:- start:10289 stop:12661 length:2373 start_codon:yes stop_codon:yes gene_type:complete